MSATGRCKSCGKPVTWSCTQYGNKMPWDPEPSDKGTHVLIPDVHNGATSYSSRPPRLSDGPNPKLYVSHFASCPYAYQHRRKRA
jgi:hypothetical protein